MASRFDKAFNVFAKAGTGVNRGLNKVIGKDVFQDIKPIEEAREFAPLSSFPAYPEPEPADWPILKGEAKSFKLAGNVIPVSAELDTCMLYRPYFKGSAKYYAQRFQHGYQNCIQDFDSLIHYFPDLYTDCLGGMVKRAYSLLLPFGVFSASMESFMETHVSVYNCALQSFQTMAGIEISRNQQAEAFGDSIGNSVHMVGGGFGVKGAMKGMAKAEAINLGVGLFGKLVAHQAKMSPEEKARAFAAFRPDIFFDEVYKDCYNTFYTLIKTLSNNGVLSVTTQSSAQTQTTIENMNNPMFPQEKIAPTIAGMISKNPFMPEYYELLKQRFGQTDEVQRIVDYFMG